MIARKLRDKGRQIAAHLLEASADDIEFEAGRFFVKGSSERAKTIQDVAFAAYTNLPDGMEAGLEGVTYYDPPNMTFPFGTYVVVVEVDRGTGEWKPIKVVAVDDCGVRINPMIVEGQITGGLTELRHRGDSRSRSTRTATASARTHRLPDPDVVGDARVRPRRADHPVAAPPRSARRPESRQRSGRRRT